MGQTLRTLVILAAAGLLAGCGVQGKWTYDRIEPDAARGKFEIARVELKSDGSYAAHSDYHGKIETSTGKYTYADGILSFTPDKGEPRSYHARNAGLLASELKVMGQEKGHAWTATMKRD